MDEFLDLLPVLMLHRADRFRPLSWEHALQGCRWRTLRDQQVVDLHPPRSTLTPALILDLAMTQQLDLTRTWVEPLPHPVRDYDEAYPAPWYVQPLWHHPGHLDVMCTYVWSGRTNHGGCCRTDTVALDVGRLVFTLRRPTEQHPWVAHTVRVPQCATLLTYVPSHLYWEKDTHRVLWEPPRTIWGCVDRQYQPLWQPRLQPVLRRAPNTPHWLDLQNFHLERQ